MPTIQKPLTTKEFNRLSAPQKRVAIAKDVIQQIKLEKYQIESGIWAAMAPVDLETCEIDQNMLLQGIPIQCRCCALGAGMLSSMRLANIHSFSEDADLEADVIPQLGKYFSNKQMAMIEAVFENRYGDKYGEDHVLREFHSDITDDEYDRLHTFGKRFTDENNRALAIFTNIVKNKGEFIP